MIGADHPGIQSSARKRTTDRMRLRLGRRARRRRRRLLLGGRLLLSGRGRGGRLGLRAVLAVGGREALAAGRLGLPALAVVLAELIERLALVVAREDLLDRRLGLRERLLLGGRDLRDLEDVPAELRLDRADELALVGVEDRVVERLLLLALRHAREQAALRLRGLVDRVLLRDGLPRLAGVERALGLRGLRLRLRQHDAQVTPLGRRELRLVLVVVVGDLGVADLALRLRHLLRELLLQQLVALLVEDVGLREARALQELLEVGGILERLLDGRVDLLLHLAVGDLDVLLGGLLLDPVAADEELEDLVAQRVVLLLALALELRLGRLGRALRRLRRGRLLVGDALREARRVGDLRLRRRGAVRIGLPRLGHGRDLHPVVEGRLLDRLIADLRHRVAGDVAPARAHKERGNDEEGAQRQRAVLREHDVRTLVD